MTTVLTGSPLGLLKMLLLEEDFVCYTRFQTSGNFQLFLYRARINNNFMLEVIKKRADFLRCGQEGKKRSTTFFTLLAYERGDDEACRVGFTCSKKVGNAVRRNAAKRRLREVAREVLGERGQDGWDYVLIGRPEITETADMRDICETLGNLMDQLHPIMVLRDPGPI